MTYEELAQWNLLKIPLAKLQGKNSVSFKGLFNYLTLIYFIQFSNTKGNQVEGCHKFMPEAGRS